MLDPLTALGLASNIVQLVDFGIRTINSGRELASTGTTEQVYHLETIITDNLLVLDRLEESFGPSGAHLHSRQAQSEGAAIGLARETRDVAQELSSLLSSLKLDKVPEGGEERPAKRRRTTAKLTMKSVFKQNDIRRLRERLDGLQQAMIFRLSVLQCTSSSTLLRSLGPITGSAEQDAMQRLASYDKLMPELTAKMQSNAKTSNKPDAAEGVINKLNGLLVQAHTLQSCQRVLKTLSFAEMHARQTRVPDAHAKTFDWAIQDDALGYTNWAARSNGIFWITGKPGCGKSTLMKHLSQHPRTMELLRIWAGRNELIVARHYFWIAGTSLQKSRIGLLRTLLVHTLEQSPELVLGLLPERFRNNFSHRTSPPWTQEELVETIRAVAKQTKHESRLCIFVDGLDEYEGEHVDLIDLLSTLAENPHIKLCISSRPWNVFTRAYRNRVDGELAVQDLTKSDIQTFVRDKMLANHIFAELQKRYPKECSSLMGKLTSSAEGVFLWVALVVRSLLRGLGNDDDLETLMRRLEEYPRDLDGYFQRMFDRIESVYMEQSARLMLASLSAEKALPFWGPRCIEWETRSPDYASSVSISKEECYGHLVFGQFCPGLNDVEATHSCSEPWTCRLPQQQTDLTRYVDARCADLLELTDNRISFIHRTARDFLRRIVLSSSLTELAGPNYDVGISLARLYQAGLKKLWDDGYSMHLIDELRSLETLIKPADLQLYASIFDNLEAQSRVRGIHVLLIRPPIVQHFLAATTMAECGFVPPVIHECDDFETLFGGN